MKSRSLLALAALLALSACASGGGRGTTPESDSQIRIEVMNNNFADVTVWLVVRGSQRDRLGTVTGKSNETFTVPWTFSEPLRLELDLLAGPRCRTREIMADPGDVLELEVQAVFAATSWCQGR